MDAVTIPVIASSGAGAAEHFSQVFEATDVQAVRRRGFCSCPHSAFVSAHVFFFSLVCSVYLFRFCHFSLLLRFPFLGFSPVSTSVLLTLGRSFLLIMTTAESLLPRGPVSVRQLRNL